MRFLLDTTLIYIYLSYILLRMFYLSVNISSSNSIFWNTMESPLFLGANVRGFLWLFLPTNLHPRERINRRLFNNYWISTNLLPKKVRPQEPWKVWLPTNLDPRELKWFTVSYFCYHSPRLFWQHQKSF